LNKRAIADEMELQFDAVALVRIAPAAKDSSIAFGLSAARNACTYPDQDK
jgi:hypothetical protein